MKSVSLSAKRKLFLWLSLCLSAKLLLGTRNMTPSRSNRPDSPHLRSQSLYRPKNGVQRALDLAVPPKGEKVYNDQPIQQFRAWRATMHNGLPWLHAAYTKFPLWPHYERFEALCPHVIARAPGRYDLAVRESLQFYANHARHQDHPPHVPVPMFGCTCGIHTKDKLGNVAIHFSAPTATSCGVVGSVRVWGHHVRHETGYRSEYAYPERLFILLPFDMEISSDAEHWRGLLEAAYGVKTGFCRPSDMEALGDALAD